MKAPKALAWSPFDIRREFGSSLRPGMDTVGHISSLKLVVTAFQLTVMPQLKSVPPAWPEGPTVGVLLSLRGSLSDPGVSQLQVRVNGQAKLPLPSTCA